MSRLLTASLILLASLSVACGDDNPSGPSGSPDPSVGLNVPFSATDIVVGTGAEAMNGRNVTLQYTLWLYNPNASENKGRQVQTGNYGFVLGSGNAIQGWHQGIPGMRVGGTRRLVIPPALGYGAGGALPDIPGNATILFEVTLLSVQ